MNKIESVASVKGADVSPDSFGIEWLGDCVEALEAKNGIVQIAGAVPVRKPPVVIYALSEK